MTEKEMIESFMKKNKVTVCADESRISNGQSRVSNIDGFSLSKSFETRTAKHSVCIRCGESFKAEYKNLVGEKILIKDDICRFCSEIIKEQNEKLKIFKTMKNLKIYNRIRSITNKKILLLNDEELDKIEDELELIVSLTGNKRFKNRLKLVKKLIEEL